MKKNILLIVLTTVVSMGMAACGKEETEATSTTEAETQLVIQLEGEIHGIQLSGGSEQADTGEKETEEAETDSSNDKKFECLPEIQEASIDSGKIQIDDVVFTIGAPVQEIFDSLEKSECEYEYDYTPDALVAKGQEIRVTFKKNGKDYFYVAAHNFTDTTCELKDCLLYATQVLTTESYAYYAGNIAAGGSYDDITAKFIDCEILKEYSDTIRQEYEVTYKIITPNEIIESQTMIKYDGYILELVFDSNTKILKYWYARA